MSEVTEKSALSPSSPITLGIVFTLVGGVAWAVGKWSDISDKYVTKEVFEARMQTVSYQIQGVKDALSGQLDALRAEIGSGDRRSPK